MTVYKALLHTWSLMTTPAWTRTMVPTLRIRKLRLKDATLAAKLPETALLTPYPEHLGLRMKSRY